MDWKMRLYETIERLKNWVPAKHVVILSELKSIQQDIYDPPMLLIAGEFNAGKSTFINALLGKRVLTSDIIPATSVVTKLTYGDEEEVIGHYVDGHSERFDRSELEQLTVESEGKWQGTLHSVSYIELRLPEKRLENLTIVDSPGLNSGYESHTSATIEFMKRADEVIWLFNYQNLGTQSELSQLKKMREIGLVPYGVVNRIDLHNDEEESLEEFLEASFRRVNGLVNGLIGISASEALEGKLESNSELLKWSNWNVIEPLILHIEKTSERKNNKLFTRLANSLTKINQLIVTQNKKFTNFPLRYSLKTFIENELFVLLKERELVEPAYKELLFLQAHFNVTPDKINTIKKVNRWVLEYENVKGETNAIRFWKEDLLPEYELYNKEVTYYNKELEEIYPNIQQLKKEWEEFKLPVLFGTKTLKAKIRESEKYQKKIDDFTVKHKNLMVRIKGLRSKSIEMDALLQEEKKALYNEQTEKIYQQVHKWNDSYLRMKREFKDVEDDFLDDVMAFEQDLMCYIDILSPLFSNIHLEERLLDSYQRCFYIFSKTKSYLDLYPNKTSIEAFKDFRDLDTLKNVSIKSNHIEGVQPIILTHVNKPPQLKVNLDGYYNNINATRWGFSILAGIATILLSIAITNNAEKPFDDISRDETVTAIKEEVENGAQVEDSSQEKKGEMMQASLDEMIIGNAIKAYYGNTTGLVNLIMIDSIDEFGDNDESVELLERILTRAGTFQLEVISTNENDVLQAYIWIEDMLVNEEMVKQGMATLSDDVSDSKYENRLRKAEEFAKENGLGIWAEEEQSEN
ncbi:dynamin family protein [Pseudalkalibacillus hwajinpoensis]|uniref:TNase-like domain-containing protein n=1 Tax=Guptibacillus hwajinpoensis TaxID=208199 RepID=A0A4U1MJ61_9BACL|nr:dynamin family protein [Pseudalkalibacillus hwajinpoensis]TKD70761.1 hypothetical protein FBF83_09105 [Pseudalkalibacillus hwajinpoensis]